jgi:CheY-like chemotaxis protein
MATAVRLLVVDDEAEMREVLAEALSAWGYEVTVAASGREAVELVATSLFEAVLLDVNLGSDNGVDVLRGVPSDGGLGTMSGPPTRIEERT